MAEEATTFKWGVFTMNQQSFIGGIQENTDNVKTDTVSVNLEKESPNLKSFLGEHYSSRINQVNKEIQIKSKMPSKEFRKLTSNNNDWINLNDTTLNQIFFEAKDAGVKHLNSKNLIKDKFNSGFSEIFNPILDYVDNLYKWDGTTDHITVEFNKQIKAKDQGLSSWMFKKWFVGMVATAIGDVVKTNETVLILKGRQNLGKTRFINNILPNELKEYMMSGVLNPSDKDHMFRLATNIIYNLDELASMRPSNVEKFKQLISSDFIKARRPYAHFDSNEKVICSFTGTVNEETFLHDLTGNRRYLVIDVLDIDNNVIIEHDKMYSQAVQLIKNEFQWWFNDKDVARMNEHTDKFRFRSAIEELIVGRFKPAVDKDEADSYLNSTEILSVFKKEGISLTDTNNYKVGRVLTNLGFKTKKIKGTKKYAVDFLKKNTNELMEGLLVHDAEKDKDEDFTEIPF